METQRYGKPLSMVSNESASSSPPSSSSDTTLMPTLSRLSQSTPRPIGRVPDEAEPTGYTAKTVRLVTKGTKEVWRRSGLGMIFPVGGKPRSLEQGSFGRSTLDVSTILYPTLRAHPPPEAHPILLLTLSNIHNVSPLITNDELFDVSLRKLEPWAGDEGDGGYVLVVLAADDGKSINGRSWPSVGWWVWKWKSLPRKSVAWNGMNAAGLILGFGRTSSDYTLSIHPSSLEVRDPELHGPSLIPALVPLFLPLISPKSHPKLHALPSLLSLAKLHNVSLSGMVIPLCALSEEARLMRDRPDLFPGSRVGRQRYAEPDAETSSTWSGTISSTWNYAASYLPFSRAEDGQAARTLVADDTKKGFWGESAEDIIAEAGGVPRLLVDLGKAILEECKTTEGIFRRTSSSRLFDPIVELLNLPLSDQPTLPWNDIAKEEPLLLPKILLRFLSDLQDPLIPSSSYPTIKKASSNDTIPIFLASLPRPNRLILEWLVPFMRELSAHEDKTRMSPLALSIVLAPCLTNGLDPIADAEMCLPPGKTLPTAMTGRTRDADEGTGTLVGLLVLWIQDLCP